MCIQVALYCGIVNFPLIAEETVLWVDLSAGNPSQHWNDTEKWQQGGDAAIDEESTRARSSPTNVIFSTLRARSRTFRWASATRRRNSFDAVLYSRRRIIDAPPDAFCGTYRASFVLGICTA